MLLHLNHADRQDRIKSAVGVAAIHALIGYALITGLGFQLPGETRSDLKLFDIPPDPPPPPLAEPDRPKAEKRKAKAAKPEGAASPKNLRDTPTPVVAPEPVIKLKVPSPVVVAPIAADGNRASAGAADVPGPGTGSGGLGTGRGSGAAGDGTGGGGGGGDGGAAIPARRIAGDIYDSDYPESAIDARASGTVYLRFTIAPTGRVSQCSITRSSGNVALDRVTCRLIQQRFRYRPARDEQGRAVADTHHGEHLWELSPEPEPIDVEPDIID